MAFTLAVLAKQIDGVVCGDKTLVVSILSPITDIQPGALVFAEGEENLKLAMQSEAGALLVSHQVKASTKPLICVDHPFKAFIRLLEVFYPPITVKPGIHPTAVIEEGAVIGQQVSIEPFVFIGANAVISDHCVIKSHVSIGRQVNIGERSYIHPHVTIYDGSRLGKHVVVHASSVIGSDGFGYAYLDGEHVKVPHVGTVVIEDDVEIGANTVIDRATLGQTHIGQGTKIDNLVQIAHSVKLGKQNIVCAFTGIAGSSVAGDGVVFAANVGVSDHVKIEDGVVLGARAGVPPHKHLKKGNVYLGSPARPRDKALEHELSVSRIPYLRKQIQLLSNKLDKLCARFHDTEVDVE